MQFTRKHCVAALFAALSAPLGLAYASTSLPTDAPPPPPLNWHSCPGASNRECAALTVPLDYADLGKGTIDLPVARARATSQSVGTLIFNPGGPGISVARSVQGNLGFFFTPEIISRFDIVGFDPRGTTERIECLTAQNSEEYWEANHLPRTDLEINKILGAERTTNEACLDNNQNQPVVEHVDTASAVRDLEQLRRAMSLDTFSYVGFSYGTFLGYRYANLYPGRLRALVLDAVADRSIGDVQALQESVAAHESAWQQFKAWCQANPACRLRGENIDTILNDILASARVNPIPAPFNPFGDRAVNDWILTFAIQVTTAPGPVTFAWTEEVITQARNGDASLARLIYDSGTGYDGHYHPDDTHRAIFCVDDKWSKLLPTAADVKALVQNLRTVSPRYGEVSFWQAAANCFGYPVRPVEPPPVPSTISGGPAHTLVIGATSDTVAPLVWSQRIASQIVGSRLLIRIGSNHISSDKSRCVQQIMDRYLIDLTVPINGTTCPTDPDLDPVQPVPVLPL